MELHQAPLWDRAPCCHWCVHPRPGAVAVPESCEAVERVPPSSLDRKSSVAFGRPHQLAILYLETTGLFDSDVSPHTYDKIFKVSPAIPGVIISTCLSLAIYHIKNKDYAKHGEMMRAMGIQFAIPFFNMIRTAVSSFTVQVAQKLAPGLAGRFRNRPGSTTSSK